MAQNDDLFHAIGGGHADAAALADLMGDTLDEHIGGLGFPGVDHMDIVVLLYAAGAARHTVGIKHKDEHALLNMPEKDGDVLTVTVTTEAGDRDGIVFRSADYGSTWIYEGVIQLMQ